MIRKSSGSAWRVGGFIAACGVLMGATGAYAASGEEWQFILNTFSFLIWGVLVMWMCAGFTMLEAGSVRTKNASMICLKNIGLYSIAGITYYLVGYNLMYVDVQEGWIGSLKFLYGPSGDELKLLSGQTAAAADVAKAGKATMSDWFFQMVFVATTASIVSGTLAERVKLWAFFAFTAVLTVIIYPIVGGLDLGRWLAQCHGVSGFRWLYHRAFDRRLGRARRGTRRRGAPRKISRRRQRQGHAAIQRPGRYFGRLHFVAGVVRLQRRLAACAVERAGCRRHEPCAGEYQPCGGGRRHSGSLLIAAHPRTHRFARRPQRCACRTGLDYGRARYRRSLLGARNRCCG